MKRHSERPNSTRRGIALIPTLMIVSAMAVFVMALFTAVLSGKRTTNHQTDDYRLNSAVESVSILATENVWSDYLSDNGGAAGTITTFRSFLDARGITNQGGAELAPPAKSEGQDLLPLANLPQKDGAYVFNNVRIDEMRVVRRDTSGTATQLWVTVSASINRGAGIVNPVLNRAVQQVWTVEPEEFTGFEYAMLANNVNCIFCHTKIDSVERWFNLDPDQHGTFDRVKVGTLETILIRHNADGNAGVVNNMDADSIIAGTLYSRGPALMHDGSPVTDWNAMTLKGYEFDAEGRIVEDIWGQETLTSLSPASDPPLPLENLYLEYSSDYASMVDGNLPTEFPPPIPDNGGVDPTTGLTTSAGEGNRVIDDSEFFAISNQAEGAITAGFLNLQAPGDDPIDTVVEYGSALLGGNTSSIQQSVEGNVILTGTINNPITLDGTVAIDGDLIINGYVKGEGTLVVRGNIYVPTDIQYLDGTSASGQRTFGIAADGTRNALALTSGGNIVIGDYQRPSGQDFDNPLETGSVFDTVSGSPEGAGADDFNFSLAEMALFNRGEWAKTQEFLPGPGGTMVANPDYSLYNNPGSGDFYTPRYYRYGDDDVVPIYNDTTDYVAPSGEIISHYYDPAIRSWITSSTDPSSGLAVLAEFPLDWDSPLSPFLNVLDPNDTTDPTLYDSTGNPRAVLSEITPKDGWISPEIYQAGVEYFEALRPEGLPMLIDSLLYTNNGIFTLVQNDTSMQGRMFLNGGIVAADLGMLVPGKANSALGNTSPMSGYSIGLQLNYDQRLRHLLTIENPLQVQLRRTLWSPTRNLQ